MQSRYDNASSTAQALAIYSLVPYLGILFCPGALVMGSIGLIRSYRTPDHAGRGNSYVSIGTGSLLLIIQLLLWWILYQAPKWAQGV